MKGGENMDSTEEVKIEEPKIEGQIITEEPIKPVEYTVEEFLAKYDSLCDEMGMELSVTPNWRKSLDTNSFSLIFQIGVIKKG